MDPFGYVLGDTDLGMDVWMDLLIVFRGVNRAGRVGFGSGNFDFGSIRVRVKVNFYEESGKTGSGRLGRVLI